MTIRVHFINTQLLAQIHTRKNPHTQYAPTVSQIYLVLLKLLFHHLLIIMSGSISPLQTTSGNENHLDTFLCMCAYMPWLSTNITVTYGTVFAIHTAVRQLFFLFLFPPCTRLTTDTPYVANCFAALITVRATANLSSKVSSDPRSLFSLGKGRL